MKCLALLVICIALFATCFADELAEVRRKRAIPQATIDEVNALVNAAIQALKTQPIPDQNKRDGKLEYWISNIAVRSVTVPTVTPTEVPNGLRWSVTNAGLSAFANWRVKYHSWIPLSTSGSVDASVSGLSVAVTMRVDVLDNGQTRIALTDCVSTIGRVGIDIHGSLSFILNLFEGTLERKIRDLIPPKICALVREFVIKR